MTAINEIPAWVSNSTFNFSHAPADLKAYAKEVLHITPRKYSVRGTGERREFYVWNTRSTAYVLDQEIALWWQYR